MLAAAAGRTAVHPLVDCECVYQPDTSPPRAVRLRSLRTRACAEGTTPPCVPRSAAPSLHHVLRTPSPRPAAPAPTTAPSQATDKRSKSPSPR
jgi:hypothetical protein